MGDGILTTVASGATLRGGVAVTAPGPGGQPATTGAAVAVPLPDRFERGSQDLDVAAEAAKLKAKADAAAGSPLMVAGKALWEAGQGLLGDDLGDAIAEGASQAAKAVAKGVSAAADALGLRQPTAAQIAEAKGKTDTVMRAFDPKNTGFVAGDALARWTGKDKVQANLDFADTDKDGKLSRAEIQRAYERRAMDRDTKLAVGLAADSKVNGGARLGLSVAVGEGLKPGQTPVITGEIDVGPDVLRLVQQQAYQQTRQAIRSRRMPVIDVPAEAREALSKLAAYNKGGSLEGAVAVNLCNPALVEAVRRGVTQAIKDQPFRNRGLIRPQGMWRVRARIAEARPVQAMIVSKAYAEISKIERKVEVLSNGVVVFQDVQPRQTGARVTYHAGGIEATVHGEIADAGRWMPR